MAMLEARPYRPFKSSEEYLEAMKEDLAEWLSTLYPDLNINAENFMDRLDTGVALCKHANYVREAAEDYLARRQARNKSMTRSMTSGLAGPILALGNVHFLLGAKSGTFFARDNVSNFITWCRKGLKIIECLLFETDDLIMRKNEKHVILCLLEVARRGAKFGMLAPMLVQMERQIDREIAADNKAKGIGCGTQTESICDSTQTDIGVGTENAATETDMFDTDSENEDEEDEGPMLMYGPQPQIVTNDLKSLDEMVRDLVEQCSCPTQFPMVRVSEGKYRIGDTKVLIFVRILRSHVMVRVGGGWDTLSHYLDKHDPCRCRAQHRSSVAARLIPRTSNQSNGIELHKAQVIFERSPPSARKLINNFNGSPSITTTSITNGSGTPAANGIATSGNGTPSNNKLSPSFGGGNGKTQRSRSPTPQRKYLNHLNNMNDNNATPTSQQQQQQQTIPTSSLLATSPGLTRRSMSPSPRRLIDIRKKQNSLDSYSSGPKSLPLVNDGSHGSNGSNGCSGTTNHVQLDSLTLVPNETTTQQTMNNTNGSNGDATTNGSNKFENISDNGSEISDEGYRSLGVIQSNAQKRESLHSQTSMEDAESNARLDQTSSDSQLSPVDDTVSVTKTPEIPETEYPSLPSEALLAAGPQSLPAILSGNVFGDNKFEQNGIYITDDEITVDIATTNDPTGEKYIANEETLDVTDSSNKSLKESEKAGGKPTKIPCSPKAQRRQSVGSSACKSGSLQDLPSRTGLPMFNRSKPVYRSVRKPGLNETKRSPSSVAATGAVVAGTGSPRKTNLPAVKDVTNTWSGRSATTGGGKKRPTINADTFSPPNNQSQAQNQVQATSASSASNSPFDRNQKIRSSHILYDSNGRRVRGCSASLNTSPVKNQASSPLAQQLLEAASSAKNDAQILEKMKALLSRYAAGNHTPSKPSSANKKGPVYEDFTTAWVHSNGNLERSSSCSPPTKMQSKRSSAASSCESTTSKDLSVAVSPRRDRGSSKIPTPIQRQRTELY